MKLARQDQSSRKNNKQASTRHAYKQQITEDTNRIIDSKAQEINQQTNNKRKQANKKAIMTPFKNYQKDYENMTTHQSRRGRIGQNRKGGET